MKKKACCKAVWKIALWLAKPMVPTLWAHPLCPHSDMSLILTRPIPTRSKPKHFKIKFQGSHKKYFSSNKNAMLIFFSSTTGIKTYLKRSSLIFPIPIIFDYANNLMM